MYNTYTYIYIYIKTNRREFVFAYLKPMFWTAAILVAENSSLIILYTIVIIICSSIGHKLIFIFACTAKKIKLSHTGVHKRYK